MLFLTLGRLVRTRRWRLRLVALRVAVLMGGLGLGGSALRAETSPPTLPPCPEVLVVSSYAPGYHWSDDELAGVVKVLKTHYAAVEPVLAFLDAKRFPLESREAWLLADLEEKCRLHPPRVIVTLDDAAFDFVRKYRARLGADLPVVFGGVNRFTPEMLAGQRNITGVSEESEFSGTFELIEALTPEAKNILVINSNSESGRASRAVLEAVIARRQYRYNFEFYENWTNRQLIERVRHLPADTVGFLLDTSLDATGQGNYNDPVFAAEMAHGSSRPLFSNSRPPGDHDWSVEPWVGLGGGMVDAGVHGEKVGELTARVLAGERADAIPVVQRTPTAMEVDYRHLHRFGLSMQSLPPGTRILNAPVSFYQINRTRLIWAAVVVLVLLGVICALLVNILQRRRAERALRAAQGELELLASAMSQSSDLVLILGEDTRVRYANGAFERITGQSASEARLRLFDELWEPRGANPLLATLRPAILQSGLWQGSFETLRAGGALVRLKVTLSPLRGDRGAVSHFLFVGRDVSVETKLEEQLRASQKLEAIGMLAGGVAHDFNNVLQIIRGQCSFLSDPATTAAENREGLGMIAEAVERAAQLTRQLLLFSRKQTPNPQPLDPNTLVADMLKLLRRVIGEHIRVELVPLPAAAALLADRGQLEQVLVNLCVNARDAMPTGGTLTLRLERRARAAAARLDLPAGEDLCITVTDTGCGMAPEVMARVFEPFFTTKPIGQGTGLGLAVVYGIVQQHRGAIGVVSSPGAGTTFELLLPMVAEKVVRTSASVGGTVPPGHGLVLLAEDDAQVQAIASRILRRNGFEVVTASDGALALAQIEQHAPRLRLVVLDVLMPNVSGREVYEQLKRLHPQLPVLFCSGYSAEMLPPGMAPDAGLALLKKPYAPDELLAAVHRLLGASPSGAPR